LIRQPFKKQLSHNLGFGIAKSSAIALGQILKTSNKFQSELFIGEHTAANFHYQKIQAIF